MAITDDPSVSYLPASLLYVVRCIIFEDSTTTSCASPAVFAVLQTEELQCFHLSTSQSLSFDCLWMFLLRSRPRVHAWHLPSPCERVR